MHGHQEILFADVANAWPLGIPTVGTVIRMRAFGQSIGCPLALMQAHQNQRAMIPTDRPQGSIGAFGFAHDTTWASDLGELIAAHHRPFLGLAIPLGKHTAGRARIDFGIVAVLAIVGINIAALGRIEAFAVVSGQVRLAAFFVFRDALFLRATDLQLLINPQICYRERFYIHFVNAFFHGRIDDLARRIGEMAGVPRVTTKHRAVRDRADIALGIDDVGSNEKLLRFFVNHAVRRSAADRLRTHGFLQVACDFVEFIGRSFWQVRSIGDHPQTIRPRHYSACATFAFFVC